MTKQVFRASVLAVLTVLLVQTAAEGSDSFSKNAPHPRLQITTATGTTVHRDLPASAPDRVIIEFDVKPLLARGATGRRQIRTEAAALESLHARLAGDLASIHRSRVGGNGGSAQFHRVEHEYKFAFAGASARVDREALPAIRALSYVKAVHPDRRVQAALESTVPHVRAPEVWERFKTRGRGITVAIVDSGIDYTHPALGGGFGLGHKVAGGYDFANDDADPLDDHGHGTHVAGIVAGAEAPVLGVAPEATLLAYKVLDHYGYGDDSGMLAAIERLLDPDGNGDPSDRADVVNMSLGRIAIADDPVVAAVEQASAAGVLFVVAAGNAGGSFTVGSPGVAPAVITVGATDRDDQVASFSSRGPLLHSWNIKPEVTAPGVDVASAAVGGGTLVASGTSMATPHVAGLAALVRELHPDWTPADVKAAIVATARPLPSVIASGAGRIDAVRAMEAVVLPSPTTLAFGIVAEKTSVWKATRTFQLTNTGDTPQSLTIRAEYPPGATVTVSRPTLLLMPGATREIAVDLSVDPGIAYARDEGVGLSGNVVVESAASSLHLPWMALTGKLVVATYRGGGDTYVALFQYGQLLGEGIGAAAAAADGDKVELLVLTNPFAEEQQRLILREEQAIDGPTVLEVSPEEAQFEVKVQSIAENGEKLEDIGSMSRGGSWWISQVLSLPSGLRLLHRPQSSVLMSRLERTTIESVEQAVHLPWTREAGYQGGVHLAALRTLDGLRQNETLSIGAGDWATATIDHPCATVCDYDVVTGLGNGTLMNTPFGGSRVDRSTTLALAGRSASGALPNVYFTVREDDHPPLGFTKYVSLISPRFRAEEGKIVAQLGAEPSPLDYKAPAGDATLPYGYGPTLLRTTMGIRWKQEELGRPGDEFSVKATAFGMRGEELADDALRYRVRMFDAAGQRYEGLRIVTDNYRMSEPMREGPHRLEIVQEYRIAGTWGTGTLTSTIDKTTGATAPSLTSMRIEDSEGRASYQLEPGEQARLVFSARQSTFFEGSNAIHGPFEPSGAKVWWRPHPSTGEWIPLPVTYLGSEDGGSDPVGAMFSADLGSLTSSVRAGVALKFELANEHGTTSWTLEPALFVTGVPRRRAVR